MKERPILFSTPMVQADLGIRKKLTRRIIKPQPIDIMNQGDGVKAVISKNGEEYGIPCPYGQVGDILWVRETFTEYPKGNFQYKASTVNGEELGKWKPSIHMPKAASRIWLEITDIRVERLQDISEQDAIAEGIESPIDPSHSTFPQKWFNYLRGVYEGLGFGPIDSFRTLWESINGSGSWNENPYVWVIEFKLIEKP